MVPSAEQGGPYRDSQEFNVPIFAKTVRRPIADIYETTFLCIPGYCLCYTFRILRLPKDRSETLFDDEFQCLIPHLSWGLSS